MAESTDARVEPAPTDLDWRRPHPVTIVVELGSALRSVLVVVVIIRLGSGGDGGVGGGITELALIALPLIAALGRWYTTRYALDLESVHHRHGLIWRKKQILPRANVQNVSTTAGIIARLSSVVELQISDASATGDIEIRFVSKTEADRLTALLRPSVATASADSAANADSADSADSAERLSSDSDEELVGQRLPQTPPANGTGFQGIAPPDSDGLEPRLSEWKLASVEAPLAAAPSGEAIDQTALVSPSVPELIRAELASVEVVALAILTVVAAGAAPLLIWLAPFDQAAELAARSTRWLIVGSIVAAPIVLITIHVISRVLAIGGFVLLAEPDRLRIRVGLLTEARVTARRERLQQIRVRRDLPHRLWGLERVEFETADVEVKGTGGTGYLSPVGPAGHWVALAAEGFGEVQLSEDDLRPVSPLTRRRVFVRFALASLLLLPLAVLNPILAIGASVATLAIGRSYSHRRYRTLGWAVSDDQYLVRSGVVLGRLSLVRLDKVQSLRVTASLFQRRLGLSTLRVSTAGHGFGGLVTLPDLTTDEAEELLSRLALRAARTPIEQTL